MVTHLITIVFLYHHFEDCWITSQKHVGEHIINKNTSQN